MNWILDCLLLKHKGIKCSNQIDSSGHISKSTAQELIVPAGKQDTAGSQSARESRFVGLVGRSRIREQPDALTPE